MVASEQYYIIIGALGIGLLLCWFRLLRSIMGQLRKKCPPRRITMASLSVLTTLSILLCAEIYIHFNYVHTDFFGFTRTAQRWWDLYWKPVNQFGYRDKEYDQASLKDKKIIFLLGDSIVAGHGINDAESRIGPILEKELGEPWRVLSIAKCGWSTTDELAALKLQLKNYTPKVVVLGYYMNDIEGAIAQSGVPSPHLINASPLANSFIVENSALINLLYWRIFRSINADIGPRYWEYLTKSVQSPTVRTLHNAELAELISTAHSHGAKVIVVLFPYLLSPGADARFLDPVKNQVSVDGATMIDLREVLNGSDSKSFVVSSSDHHPNEKLHATAARKVSEAIAGANLRQ